MSDHDGRLDKLEDHAVRTEGRLSAIEGTQAAHGSKLDSIAASIGQLSTSLVRYDSRPVFDFHAWVKTVGVLFTVCAILGGLATWFVLTMTAADNRVTAVRLDYQASELQRIRDAMGWRPTFESKAPN